MNRRQFIASMLLAGGAFPFLNMRSWAEGIAGLNAYAAKRGVITYGCAVKHAHLSDPSFVKSLLLECGSIVAEFECKRYALEPIHNQFNFLVMDSLLDFAQKNHLKFRGHTLVWHAGNPRWLDQELSRRPNELLLTDYVQRVVGRYKGLIYSWDVVNEAIKPEDGAPNGLRKTVWLNAFGERYIDLAFTSAHDADPSAMLVYNDYNVEGIWKHGDAWRSATLGLLARLKSRHVPIHAYGLQAHLDPNDRPVNERVLSEFLRKIVDMGLRIQVTELDVKDLKPGRSYEEKNRVAADEVRRFLDVVLSFGVTDDILTWGLSDRYSWLNDKYGKGNELAVSPLPLGVEMQRKLMWNVLRDVLSRR